MRIEARVDRVTVFERGAKVTRVTRLPAPAPSEFVITGLPLGLLDDTVRVSAHGASILSAAVVLESPGTSDELPTAPAQEVEAAQAACDLAAAELERLERELAAAEHAPLLAAQPEGEPPAPAEKVTAARRALAALRQRRLAALRRSRVEAKHALEERQRQLAAARERDARASSARSPRELELRKAVRVTLAAEAEAEPELELEYGVMGARWVPTYVARLDAQGLELTARASLMQRTGEDWTGVALELSTAAMSRPSALPELTSLRLGRQQPAPAKRLRPPPQGVAELFADYQRELGSGKPAPEPPAPEPFLRQDRASGPFDDDVDGAEELEDKFEELAADLMSAPAGAPSDELAPQAKRRSAWRGSAPGPAAGMPRGGGAVMAPGPPLSIGSAPAPAFAKKARLAPKMMMEASFASADIDEAPPPPVAQLDYFGLTMAGPDDPSRGQLVVMAMLARYQCTGVEASVLAAGLRASESAATEVDRAARPAGTSDRWSHTFDYALAADGRVDVPGDGCWHSIALGTRRAAPRLHHLAVPREQADVFRRATAPNPFAGPLLPGPVDVYDHSRFLLTAPLELVAPGGELELPLGADASVKIARNCRYHEEVSGVLRGGLRLIHEVTIDIQNLSPAPIDLEVRERVPVAAEQQEDDITVKVTACRPPWQPWSPPPKDPSEPTLRGGYAWTLPVAPRAKTQLTATYEIAIAGKHELVGGNRREP